jgi:hypothetical protein
MGETSKLARCDRWPETGSDDLRFDRLLLELAASFRFRLCVIDVQLYELLNTQLQAREDVIAASTLLKVHILSASRTSASFFAVSILSNTHFLASLPRI